jgi:hypothetical protein
MKALIMDTILILVFGFIIVGVLLTAFLKSNDDEASEKKLREYPYVLNEKFMSPAEVSFFHVLQQVTNNRLYINSKVRLGDVFWVKPRDKRQFRAYRNKIDRKHVDFLLCDPATLRPIVAIELDDKSHQRQDRQERDAFVDKVFNAAGVPLLHVPAKRGYVMAEVETLLLPYLTAAPQGDLSLPQNDNNSSFCPKCGNPLVLRTVKRGDNAGKQFWGCSNYPTCKTVIPIS